jgi:hypothetical protein
MNLVRFALMTMPVLLAAQQSAEVEQQAPNPPTRPQDMCSVEGQVSNAVTGEPLKKARVVLQSWDGRNPKTHGASTDAEGRFLIQDVEPGNYSPYAERNGFMRAQYGQRGTGRSNASAARDLTLSPGQHVRDVVFHLTPQGVIAGRVLDEDGEPVVNVQIGVLRYSYGQGKRPLPPAGYAMTDDLGEYRVFALDPGKYYLSATYRPPNMLAADRTAGGPPQEGYAPTYFPGTNDPTGAAPIELGAGVDLRGMDIKLLKTRAVRIRGRLHHTASDSLPRNVMLNLMPRGRFASGFWGGSVAQARRQDGFFEFRAVTPGAYVLLARCWDEGDGKGYSARQAVDVGSNNLDNVSLMLTTGLELKGSIRVDGSDEIRFENMRVRLESQNGWAMWGVGNTEVTGDGNFTVRNVAEENYTLHLWRLPENFYVKSIRMGDADGLENGLDLTRGAPGALEIVISANGGKVEGRVLDANQQPANEATVVLVPDAPKRERTQLFKARHTDAQGHFAIPGIAPGDYKLFAWEQVDEAAYEDPDFLKPFENQGETVAIRESGHETRQLKLIPAGTRSKTDGN